MKFCFGDIVVVEDILIGVIVKSWTDKTYEVYVRLWNTIKTYNEDQIERYMVRHKYLNDEEVEWQYNAVNGL
jgi:uncharacterized membrane protein